MISKSGGSTKQKCPPWDKGGRGLYRYFQELRAHVVTRVHDFM